QKSPSIFGNPHTKARHFGPSPLPSIRIFIFNRNGHRKSGFVQLSNEVNEVIRHILCVRAYQAIIADLDDVRDFDLVYSTDCDAVAERIEIVAMPMRRSYGFEESPVHIVSYSPIFTI